MALGITALLAAGFAIYRVSVTDGEPAAVQQSYAVADDDSPVDRSIRPQTPEAESGRRASSPPPGAQAPERNGVEPSTATPATEPAVPKSPAVPKNHEQLLADMTEMAERAVARFPNDPMAYDLQGRVLMYQGKSAAAARAWEKCLKLESRRPDALHGLAQLAIKRGDDAEAESLLRRALEIDPRYPQAAHQLAEVLMRRQEAAEAARVMRRYVDMVPASVESVLQLAQIELQLNDYDRAAADFERVIERRPASSEARLGLGTALMRLGRRDEARKVLEKSRALRAKKKKTPEGVTPEAFDLTMTRVNHASSTLYAARLYQARGDLLEAARLCQRAIQVDPKNLPSRLLLIDLYQQLRRLPDAIRVCEGTVDADPENPKLLWRLGVLYAQAGRFDAAVSALKKVVELAPDNAQAHAGLAEVYLESRQHPTESLRLARKAVSIEPSALNHVLLGRVYFQLGDLPNAKKALGEAVRLAPDNGTFRQLYDQLPAVPPVGKRPKR